jgi:hypothetical protein
VAPRRPILSPIARPGRRYITGLVLLAVVLVAALIALGVRFVVGVG